MPRKSFKKIILEELEDCAFLAMLFQTATLFESSDDSEDDLNLNANPGYFSDNGDVFSDTDSDTESEDEIGDIVACTYSVLSSCRYVQDRSRIPRSIEFRYTYFLNQVEDDFRAITRVSKEVFHFLVNLIARDPVFQNMSLFQQAHVHWQLACALDRLGNDGQGVSAARSKVVWGLGHGTVFLYYRRVCHALCNLRHTYIQWPDAVERSQISIRSARKGFRGVVGFVDGTTFPLHCKPSLHGSTYLDRKRRYSINAQVVCDDQHRIVHFLSGMPGSCHDSRIFSHSPLVQTPQRYFFDGQYLLADSGYAASQFLVPAYKSRQRDLPNDPEDMRNIERFNTFLARARVVNEHTIGLLKSRWSSLRGLRINLWEQGDISKVIEHAVACVILHNIALDRDPWDEQYIEVDEDDTNPGPGMHSGLNLRQSEGQQKRFQVRLACAAFHNRNATWESESNIDF